MARLSRAVGAIHGRALSTSDIQYGYEITDRIPSLLGVEQSFLLVALSEDRPASGIHLDVSGQ